MNTNAVIAAAMIRHGVKEFQTAQQAGFEIIIGIYTKPEIVEEKANKIEAELNDDLMPLRFKIMNVVGRG